MTDLLADALGDSVNEGLEDMMVDLDVWGELEKLYLALDCEKLEGGALDWEEFEEFVCDSDLSSHAS